MPEVESPADAASRKALNAMYECLEGGQSFRLEAGAGAGKTYSLVKALQILIERNQRVLQRRAQRIACITFTNVAKFEIEARIDNSPLVFCDTTHAFCWSLICGFQEHIRRLVESNPEWAKRIEEAGGLGKRAVEYGLGYRSIREDHISLNHDDVLRLTVALTENSKFRRLMTDRFPIILIDEYQDTNVGWIEAIKTHFLGQEGSPIFGFFGDHWQKIYGDGCGRLEHPAIKEIGKEANFRSVQTIVDVLNNMRPELPQFVKDPEAIGQARVFHTNGWPGQRQTGSHWGGDLPAEIAHNALERVKEALRHDGWDLASADTKILMLTHRVLASEQGYASLPAVFQYKEAFAKKEHQHIAYFVDVLEPACVAFLERRYGAMFEALGASVPLLSSPAEKTVWSMAMEDLITLRETGTVGQVLDHLWTKRRPRLPDAIEDHERELRSFDRSSHVEVPRDLSELEALRNVPYKEVISLRRYLLGHSPFETTHGVKGAEFDNVLVVIGRGWNLYNFEAMLELFRRSEIPPDRQEAFERNRNLFYVACSRPKRRLALLFTQRLSADALRTLEDWFGSGALEALTL